MRHLPRRVRGRRRGPRAPAVRARLPRGVRRHLAPLHLHVPVLPQRPCRGADSGSGAGCSVLGSSPVLRVGGAGRLHGAGVLRHRGRRRRRRRARTLPSVGVVSRRSSILGTTNTSLYIHVASLPATITDGYDYVLSLYSVQW